MGIRRMEIEEMRTLLMEVASLVNSRPLMAMSKNINNMTPITPNKLILGYDPIFIPEDAPEFEEAIKGNLRTQISNRWRLRVEQKNAFWLCWRKDYLMTLSARGPWINSDKELHEGELVLITKENTPRSHWPLGRVRSLITGSDGKIRTVRLRIGRSKYDKPKKDIIRPVQQLVRLECVDEELSSVTKIACTGEEVVPPVPSVVYRRKLRSDGRAHTHN
jgi:hypothetical protein